MSVTLWNTKDVKINCILKNVGYPLWEKGEKYPLF